MVGLTKAEETMLLDTSLERVMNNAIFVGMKAMTAKNADLAERAGILVDDCEAMKVLADKLWNHARNEVLKSRMA